MKGYYVVTLVCVMAGVHSAQSSSVERREICNAEHFSARCGTDEVVKILSAQYGRMELGRCVKVNLGYIGCSVDALALLDQLCSGQPTCTVQVADSDERFANLKACIDDLKSYLEVQYTCVRVAQPDESGCRRSDPAQLVPSASVLSSHVTDESGCGSLTAPWAINASPGQLIKVSMSDFGVRVDSDGPTQSRCKLYGYISEPGLRVNQTLCGGLARERDVYMSSSDHVNIQMIPKKDRDATGSFLIHYEVQGCPDITPPPNAWYKRNGSVAVIGCEWSEHSWHLRCDKNTWIGVVGNCSRSDMSTKDEPTQQWSISPLLSVSLIIGLGVLVVVLFCVALIGCICILCGRNKSPLDRNTQVAFQPSDQEQAFLYYPGRPIPVPQINHGTMEQTDSRTLFLTKPNATDELIHIWETPLPIPKQVQSSTGATDDSATMSEIGTLPGTPQVCKDGSTMSRSDYSTDTYWAGTDRYFDNDLGWVTLPKKK